MATRRRTVGSAGESVAAHFLERRGAAVVRRNLRVDQDEIDLVVRIGRTLIAIEVKTGIGVDRHEICWNAFFDSPAALGAMAASATESDLRDSIT